MGVPELLLPPSQFWEAGKRLATFDDKKCGDFSYTMQ